MIFGVPKYHTMPTCSKQISKTQIFYFRNSGPHVKHVTGSNSVAATFHVTFKNATPYVSISGHVVLSVIPEDTSSLCSFGWTRYLDNPSPQTSPVKANSSNIIGAASCHKQ